MKENKGHFSKLVIEARANKAKFLKAITSDGTTKAQEDSENEPSNLTKEISDLGLNTTPKRKMDQDSMMLASSPSPAKKAKNLDLPKQQPMYSKKPCPICDQMVSENLIERHVNRCLERPEPRTSKSKHMEDAAKIKHNISDSSGDDEDILVDKNLLNVTPEITVEPGDLICSTPIAEEKENHRHHQSRLSSRRRCRRQD